MVRSAHAGLEEECQNRLGEDPNDAGSIFKKINKVFEYLPLAAVISNKIFCVSSGIGSNLSTIEEINKIKRPLTINYENQTSKENKIVIDLLWSDPVINSNQGDTRVAPAHPDQRRPRTVPRAGAALLGRPHKELHAEEQPSGDREKPRVRHGRRGKPREH